MWTGSPATAAAVALLLGGCASGRPDLIDERFLPVGLLITNINCELYRAVSDQIDKKGNNWLKDWQGAYTITLKANETGALKLSGTSFPVPFPPTVLLNFGVEGSYSRTANRTATYEFNIDFADLRREDCSSEQIANSHPFLSGQIGFADWLDRAARAFRRSGAAKAGPDTLTSIGHTFEFQVKTSGGISPSFVISPLLSEKVTIGPSLTLDRDDDHIVEVAFAKKAAPPPRSITLVIPKLTPEQKDTLDKLTQSKARAQAQAAQQRAFLSSPQAQRVLALQNQLETSSSRLQALQTGKTLEGIQPDGGPSPEERNLAAQIQSLSQTLSAAETRAALDAANRARSELRSAEDRAQRLDDEIATIKARPLGQQISQREVSQPQAFVPANQNPAVTGTLLRLLFERTSRRDRF
jgi:hypothetical protein